MWLGGARCIVRPLFDREAAPGRWAGGSSASLASPIPTPAATIARMLIDLLRAILLGIVEGVTEFLPISSTGHLLVAERLVGFNDPTGGTFAIAIQLGAVFAVLLYYGRDLIAEARAFPHDAVIRRFWLAIVIAFLPAAAAGFLARHWIKDVLFASPAVVGVALIVGGVIFLAVERLPARPERTMEPTGISLPQAIAVGLAQVTALVPGVSRSGATIVGGMLAGVDRRAATVFSFYLAIVTLGSATVFDLVAGASAIDATGALLIAVGMVTAGIVAWLSIGWLLRYVSGHTFVAFGWYRIVAGIVILLLGVGRIL
jgi:undecaprenyl-diphosphatase